MAGSQVCRIPSVSSHRGGGSHRRSVATLGCVRAEEKERFSDTERLSEEETPEEAISTQQVEFRNLRMGVGGPSVELNGRVRNNNPTHTLTQVVVRLRVLECDASYRCDTLEEQTESISVSVPPQQTREMSHHVFFNALGAARLNRSWNHELLSVSGSLIPLRTP